MTRDSLPVPQAKAVLLADQILVEAGSNKKSLIGLYTQLYAPRMPMRRQLQFFVEITGAMGEYDFTLELVHLEKDKIVARGAMEKVVAADRLASIEMVIRLPARFREFGSYEFRLLCGSELIATRVLRIREAPRPEEAPEHRPDGSDG